MRALIILLSLVLVGCEPVKFTKVKPKSEDVAGYYTLTTASKTELAQAGYSSTNVAFVKLNADGMFEIKDLPDRWRLGNSVSQQTTNASYDSGNGTWKIESHGEGWTQRWGILLDFPNSKGFSLQPPQGQYVYNVAMLRNDKPPYVLHFGVGDPDGGEGLELIKEKK